MSSTESRHVSKIKTAKVRIGKDEVICHCIVRGCEGEGEFIETNDFYASARFYNEASDFGDGKIFLLLKKSILNHWPHRG